MMRISKWFTMMVLMGSLAGQARAAADPLPPELYEVRQPEQTVAKSLTEKVKERAVGPKQLATMTRAPRPMATVLASAVVPADPRAAERVANLEALAIARMSQPTAQFATHVGSDAMPIRPPLATGQNGLASAAIGTCTRCGARVSDSYGVLCDACGGR